jgi:hypothetical protein
MPWCRGVEGACRAARPSRPPFAEEYRWEGAEEGRSKGTEEMGRRKRRQRTRRAGAVQRGVFTSCSAAPDPPPPRPASSDPLSPIAIERVLTPCTQPLFKPSGDPLSLAAEAATAAGALAPRGHPAAWALLERRAVDDASPAARAAAARALARVADGEVTPPPKPRLPPLALTHHPPAHLDPPLSPSLCPSRPPSPPPLHPPARPPRSSLVLARWLAPFWRPTHSHFLTPDPPIRPPLALSPRAHSLPSPPPGCASCPALSPHAPVSHPCRVGCPS